MNDALVLLTKSYTLGGWEQRIKYSGIGAIYLPVDDEIARLGCHCRSSLQAAQIYSPNSLDTVSNLDPSRIGGITIYVFGDNE